MHQIMESKILSLCCALVIVFDETKFIMNAIAARIKNVANTENNKRVPNGATKISLISFDSFGFT